MRKIAWGYRNSKIFRRRKRRGRRREKKSLTWSLKSWPHSTRIRSLPAESGSRSWNSWRWHSPWYFLKSAQWGASVSLRRSIKLKTTCSSHLVPSPTSSLVDTFQKRTKSCKWAKASPRKVKEERFQFPNWSRNYWQAKRAPSRWSFSITVPTRRAPPLGIFLRV